MIFRKLNRLMLGKKRYCRVAVPLLTESSKSPVSIAKGNKQWVGTCLYQEWFKPLLINCGAVIQL